MTTPYEALGVRPDAPPDEVRRAYLRLAREHHPDRHGTDGSGSDDAERRMQDINAAWAVLGDPDQRAAYDRSAAAGGHDSGAAGTSRPTVDRPSSDFVPLHADDEDDDDSWRYEPDEFDPETSVGRFLSAGPPLLLLVGLGLLGISLVIGFKPVAALGIAVVLFAVLLFVSAPLVAVMRSQSTEQQREARRRPDGR